VNSDKKPAILVVEDERVVAWDLREMINAFGYDCYALASSADEALRAAENKRPDLVLMDLRLKGPVDGIDAARILQEKYGAEMKIVFLTAHAQGDMGDRASLVQAAAWLRKPIHAPLLRKALAQVLGVPGNPAVE
jgi:two-component system, response regulator PdtaR